MDEIHEIRPKLSAKVLHFSMVGCAAALIAIAGVEFLFRHPGDLLVAGLAVLVALLVSKFEISVPRSRSVFSPKWVFAIWGAVTLGIWGGLILMFVASLGESSGARKGSDRLVRVSSDILITYVATLVFFVSFGYFSGPDATEVAGGIFIPNRIVISTCLMAAAQYLLRVVFSTADTVLAGGKLTRDRLEDLFAEPFTGHAIALGFALCAFLVFNHFGMSFGLMVVPAAIAANISYRIHMRSLEQKTREISEASRLHLATVEALATAIDARDQVGVGHVRRTQIYAVGLGRILGLAEDVIDALRTGALLHDVGKLAVPDHILNKPGELTPAEMEKTKIHSSVGASMLDKVGFTTPVVPTVKYHHEFWDGSGYPEGLRGSQIPLSARILSVADAFDTLRGARPYRPAVPRADACSFLRARAGSQFDPKLVETFLRNLRVFEEEIESEGLAYETEPVNTSDLIENSFVEQIKRANREVFTLYSLARDFGSAMGLNETLRLFAEKVKEFVPYDICVVYLLDQSGGFAEAVHISGCPTGLKVGNRLRVGEGATGYALKKRKSVENVDPALDFAFMNCEGIQDLKTMGTVPLIADDVLLGAISLYSSEVAHYQDEHFRLLDTVSKIAAEAIAKSQRHARTETHAMTDAITGLPNARSFQLEFDKEVQRANRSNSGFQLLMLDLDGFKAVNDTYGHKTGDGVLTAIGAVIKGQLREYDFLARYAGDEFIAIVPDTNDEDVRDLCSRIKAAVQGYSFTTENGERASVGVSVGAASYPDQGDSVDQLVTMADREMYLMKFENRMKPLGGGRGAEKDVVILDLDDLITEEPVAGVVAASVSNKAAELPVSKH